MLRTVSGPIQYHQGQHTCFVWSVANLDTDQYCCMLGRCLRTCRKDWLQGILMSSSSCAAISCWGEWASQTSSMEQQYTSSAMLVHMSLGRICWLMGVKDTCSLSSKLLCIQSRVTLDVRKESTTSLSHRQDVPPCTRSSRLS